MKEYLEKSSKILDELQTTEQGLSEAEAARRLSEHGPNRLAAGKKKSNLQRFFEELKDPMILPMKTAISSMPTVPLLPASWMLIARKSSTDLKSIVAYMAEPVLTFMHSIQTAIKALPAI